MHLRTSRLCAALAVASAASTALAASYTFPSFNIPTVTPTETLVPVDVSGAPALVYDQYSMSVAWSAIAGDPWSNEARMRLRSGSTALVGGGGPTDGIPAGTGAANNGNPTTLTWSGDLLAPYTGGSPLSVGARQTFAGSSAAWNNVSLTVSQSVLPTGGNYQIDDGTAEDGIGITGTGVFDMVWLNRFPVQAGGEVIQSVEVAFGSPGNTSTGYNASTPVEILLYEDANGGSSTDAVLKASVMSTMQNVNSNTFVSFDVPDTEITGSLLVGAVVRGLTAGTSFVAGIDQTDPDLSNRSFIGFTSATTVPPSPLDISNLGSMGANFGSTDGFGLPGNFLIRATGVAVPEPASAAVLSLGALALAARRRRA